MEKIESREYARETVKEFRETKGYKEIQLKTIEIALAIAHERGEIHQLENVSKSLK